jgi:hypothetical protein
LEVQNAQALSRITQMAPGYTSFVRGWHFDVIIMLSLLVICTVDAWIKSGILYSGAAGGFHCAGQKETRQWNAAGNTARDHDHAPFLGYRVYLEFAAWGQRKIKNGFGKW